MRRPRRSVTMNDAPPSLRPDTLALDGLIQAAIARVETSAGRGPADSMLFLGNRHQAFPTAVVSDPVLEPVDKLVWMVIMLAVGETGGHSAFPGYAAIGTMANVASRSTIARAIAILRATRWLTLCARVRKASGQFRGNVFAVHDEPLPLADARHLDAGYMAFLRHSLNHGHARVRAVAQGVLASIDEDSQSGHTVAAEEHPLERRLQSRVATQTGGPRRFFAFTENAIRNLRRDVRHRKDVTHRQAPHHDRNSNTDEHRVRNLDAQNSNSVCSSSYINKTTTTYSSDPSKFDLTGKDGQPLIYPKRLMDNQRGVADRYLRALAPEQRQPILDELEGRFRSEAKGMRPVYDPIRFLHALCEAARNGRFQSNLGLGVVNGRRRQAQARQRADHAHTEKPAKETDAQRRARLAAGRARVTEMREVLGMRRQTEKQGVTE
jgi:hypothetical protein